MRYWLFCVPVLGAMQSTSIERTGTFENLKLRESSGVAVSRSQPGLLWTHQDSGDGPYIYATTLEGSDLGRFRVTGAVARDWEDIAAGACPEPWLGDCLFIADTGDNNQDRTSAFIYAVREPARAGGALDSTPRTEMVRRLEFRYERGARDVEAMFVARDGSIHLFTKGRWQDSEHYVLSPTAWDTTNPVARWVAGLPIHSRATFGRWVTGAALAPSGRLVAVRTYSEVYLFAFDGTRLGDQPLRVCSVAAAEPQGEAVDFLDETTMVLTSEAVFRGRAPIHRLRCAAS